MWYNDDECWVVFSISGVKWWYNDHLIVPERIYTKNNSVLTTDSNPLQVGTYIGMSVQPGMSSFEVGIFSWRNPHGFLLHPR
jgi:hypothetical protein